MILEHRSSFAHLPNPSPRRPKQTCKQPVFILPSHILLGSTNSCGRTAWSSTVTIQGRNIAARYWYDGDYINNAKEDAAEVAIMQINPQIHRTACSGQIFPPSGYGGMCSWNNHQ
ncbi:hypothetical protein Egran_04218 [Elaphomyces granulatus]|uniref:Uncharacterized protein n=1 Tax=Elaphomyces granulatus TaxID=519963 RepID=A0A232LVF2_9EURO|nr:hypothetical protein Egran_04218 [Elaphomyces granulatus]